MNAPAAHRPNISDELCQLIRGMIADCELTPGTRVNEVRLAQALQVSRTPLREALSKLAAEGLVECRPRRGFFIYPLSTEEVRQLYPLRALLDPEALRQAGLPDAQRLLRLRRLNEQIVALDAPCARAIDLNDEWHRLLLENCPNRVLLEFIDRLIWKTRRYEYAYLMQMKNMDIVTGEHEAILAALERADLEGACELLRKNMTSAMQPLIEWLRTHEE